jgi:tetratricopeptide (TPR) repeat protein
MRRFFAAMMAVIERHGGTLEKFSGDEVMAVFGVPVVHEDDALRAARAALEMRSALDELGDALEREHGVRLQMRIGINTGEVIAGDPADAPLVTGEAVNIGKRLQEAAAPGEIVLGPVAVSLIREAVETEPIGPLELRGRAEPLSAFRLVGISESAPDAGTRFQAPFVGRRRELRRVRAAYARARDKAQPALVVVLGDAGIGKTRLARELTGAVAHEANILVGRCASYGEGATYLPLADVVRQATREASLEELVAGEEDAEQVVRGVRALMVPVENTLPASEASWAVRRFLEALARRRPLVLVLEDLHWAEPTLLDLVEYVAERSADVPLVLLALTRPSLLDRRPQWSESNAARVVVPLTPLDDNDGAALVSTLAADYEVDPNVGAQIAEAAEGNPLFAEQLLAFVVERGPDALDTLPPTIEALLASRLDGLGALERSILERASVIGRDFRQSEVAALSPPEEAGIVGAALTALIPSGLVRRRRSTAAAPDAYVFHHALIRDAAYAAVPKGRRAELHEEFADWLARRGDAADEVVGYHLEQAHRYLAELGPLSRHARQLASEGGERLGRAGMRAFQRGDLPAADNLLVRATALLSDDSERRRELLTELGLSLRLTGQGQRAEEALAKAIAASEHAQDQRLRLRGELELTNIRIFAGGDSEELLEVAGRAIPVFEAIGDDRSLGRAWLLCGMVKGTFQCKNAEWEDALENALVHYRRARWPTTACVGELAAALFYGPRPVDEGMLRCNALLREDAGRVGSANVLVWMAGLQAMKGGFAQAREGVAHARGILDEFGFAVAAAGSCDYVAA